MKGKTVKVLPLRLTVLFFDRAPFQMGLNKDGVGS
jgi:hypothetical protein